jgi:proline iminopeptidase
MILASASSAPAEERMVDLPTGARIFVEIKGAGPPLLAIHGGLGLDHSYFEPWLDPLESGFQLIYPDLRGEGRSADVADSEFTLDKMIDDLEALRTALGIKRWAVLGHSYGGFLAQAYALKYSDTVAGLILADTSPAPRLISRAAARPWLAARMTPMIAAASGEIARLADRSAPEGGDEEFKALWHAVLPVYFDAPPPEALVSADRIVYREHAFVLGARLTDGFDIRTALARLTIPTLILVGKQDAILPLSHSEALAKAIPGARIMVFDHSGHFPFVEEPARFVAAIRAFLGQ